ncbi:unnamed protein product [Rotaria sordida]|uniref:Uncharacterized protein n=1 Tax=Rotaria sordida TaxID=392033 RepID=A0A815N4F6_9BILA|nr:unnamed protein product [Rotaria sordida]CAF1432316.1 unnamed protein product [Rotaria sordida]
MNFHYTTSTTHRPQTKSSHFNEDARCDNEVNLILEKNNTQHFIEQSSISKDQQQSVVVNQTDQYYFMPIRELNSTMALPSSNNTNTNNNNNSNVLDSSSILLTDLNNPSTQNLFDYSSSTPTMNTIDLSTVNKSNTNNNFNLTDADLAALFVSSIVSTTTIDNENELSSNNNNNNNNTLDDVFLQQVNELVDSSQPKSIGPPPGFENYHFNRSLSSDNSKTISSISNVAIQPQVSSSDTINFSQLLQSTIVDAPQQQPIGGNVHSSSSSHSSFTSDEQSIFFPMTNHHYSSTSLSSQIFSTNNTPSSSTTTTTTNNLINSNTKPYTPNSLSLKTKNFSSIDTSNIKSPISTKSIDGDLIIKSTNTTSSHIFSSPNSFFSNSHRDFASTKPLISKTSSTNRQSSSSTSSSTSSSIDEALIQLSQQQKQQQSHVPTVNKLFYDESLSIFNYSSPQKTTMTNIDKQQNIVHDNINFLASMAVASTPEPSWQQTTVPSNINIKHKMQSLLIEQQQQQQQTMLSQSPSRNLSTNMHELMENLNELCYRGFDELNALIQEQRWVENYLNVNSPSHPSPSSPLVNINGTNCCSSRILVVPEYFIFKCKKIEITASDTYELLSIGRPELRLRDLMFVFKSWKESITNAELVHQEEETRLRLNTEHPHTYYMNETVLQAAFDHISYAIRQLSNMTQQARAAFQYATLNVFQMSSRQQQSQGLSNSSLSSNIIAFAQLQAMQQQKSSSSSSSSSIHRISGSLRTTP